jgi:hypothetical protein
MDLIRTFIVSQLPYKSQIEAENQPYKIKAISDLLTSIQQAIKTILGLQCLPLTHLYGSRPAGLACPNPTWTVVNNCLVTLHRQWKSSDEVLLALNSLLEVDLPRIIDDTMNVLQVSKVFENHLDLTPLKIVLEDNKRCKAKRLTESLRKQCVSRWFDTNTGIQAGSKILKKSVVVKSTMEYAPYLSQSQFKGLVQIRSGCVNLKTRPHQRLANGNNVSCRMCGIAMETIGHVLGECPELKNMIVKRHDAAVDIIYKHLHPRSDSVTLKEQVFEVNGRNLKPDLILIDQLKATITIIDVTIRVEKDEETREIQTTEKIQKYDALRHHLGLIYNTPTDKITVCPVWIGARGTLLKCDVNRLQQLLGLTEKTILSDLLTTTVSWSASIYNAVTFKQ